MCLDLPNSAVSWKHTPKCMSLSSHIPTLFNLQMHFLVSHLTAGCLQMNLSSLFLLQVVS